jgi:hypothetical protein
MMMINSTHTSNIYCHRGFWREIDKQNSMEALLAAERQGFSIETDLRSLNEKLVIAHDAEAINYPYFESILTLNSSFALNIKQDGLSNRLLHFEEWIRESNSFFFDGSVPEMLRYKTVGLPHALRLSEYESSLSWATDIVWLDSFHQDWWVKNDELISLIRNKKVIVVSPEIHGRDPRYVWDFLAESRALGRFEYSICTDKPIEFATWK